MTKKQAAKYQAAVNRGVRLLDKVKPKWEEKIDLSTLRLSSPYNCILGQLYGEFNDGSQQLYEDALSVVRNIRKSSYSFLAIDEGGYGFNVLDAGGSYEEFISYLTELWTAVIEKRMAAEVQQERDRRNK
mgnify:CR=1 FL=1